MMNKLVVHFRHGLAKSNPDFGAHRQDWSWEWTDDGGWLDVGAGEWRGEDFLWLNEQIIPSLIKSYCVVRRWDKEHFSPEAYAPFLGGEL